MAGVSDGELAALADDELTRDRRAEVEAAVAASPELARRVAVQVRVASAIRAAAERVEAPARLRAALAAKRDGRGNPAGSGHP
jgi:anti-sigma factor RsiW